MAGEGGPLCDHEEEGSDCYADISGPILDVSSCSSNNDNANHYSDCSIATVYKSCVYEYKQQGIASASDDAMDADADTGAACDHCAQLSEAMQDMARAHTQEVSLIAISSRPYQAKMSTAAMKRCHRLVLRG